eukprot:TRINITY_DN38604_c0_g1_i1.p1 TRINITY_DN38604_c0_g1~~TRINITY_DN38604_c0_g1_i1.p1  ORF type:complete len:321 (+),score=66.47 TRINITY_DN38604_c0_g1_i1:123-965(+)
MAQPSRVWPILFRTQQSPGTIVTVGVAQGCCAGTPCLRHVVCSKSQTRVKLQAGVPKAVHGASGTTACFVLADAFVDASTCSGDCSPKDFTSEWSPSEGRTMPWLMHRHVLTGSPRDQRGLEEEEPRARQARIRRLRAAARRHLRVRFDEASLEELNLELTEMRAARQSATFYGHRQHEAVAMKDSFASNKLRAGLPSNAAILDALGSAAQTPTQEIVEVLEDSILQVMSGETADSTADASAGLAPVSLIAAVSVAAEDPLPPVRKFSHMRQRTTYIHAN